MIVAVAILFHPDRDRLGRFVGSVLNAVDALVLVDNSPASSVDSLALDSRAAYVLLGLNVGVAAAQNVGIRKAVELGADHVLILDQDSDITAQTVAGLTNAFAALRESGEKVGAVGAYYVESHSRHPAEVTSEVDGKIRFLTCQNDVSWSRSDTLISSGCLISVECLRDVGIMTELLFIDWVDLEWCLRAKKRGWKCFMAPAAKMEHTIGHIRVTTRKGKPAALHSSFRLYYQVRNSLVLCGQGWVGQAWRREFFRQGVTAKIPCFLYHCPHKLSALWAIAKGAVVGLWMVWKYRQGLPVTRL